LIAGDRIGLTQCKLISVTSVCTRT